jgi:flagellar hook protein FlgE
MPIDSIYVAMTGLNGFSQGLRVIANNTANINTPGFKGSTLQFADLFYSNGGSQGGTMQVGYGLNTAGTVLNFKQGELSQTGNSLDLAVDGQGLFTLQDANGNIHYTRAGQFTFDAAGVLVSRIDGSKVMGFDSNGNLAPITLTNLSTAGGKATTTVNFAGNLSSAATTPQIVNGVTVYDGLGGQHTLSLKLTNDSATTPGQWTVQVLDGATTVATDTIQFNSGVIDPANATVSFTYAPSAVGPVPIVLDFSKNVTSFASGSLSSLAFSTQDGYPPGSLTGVSFDAMGTLVLSYSNGQTVKGARLALGRFDSLEAVESVGNNEFDATNGLAWHMGKASEGGFGAVRAGMIELSNVDLSREFSDLVIMQRGYQASSQVISTANDMLQELFQMKGH